MESYPLGEYTDEQDMPRPFPSVVCLITSYNRHQLTLECIAKLFQSNGVGSEFALKVILVDASSPDRTAEKVQAAFPQVTVVSATSETYWGGGMRRAASTARGPWTHQLWLNDDVSLHADALTSLIEQGRQSGDRAIVVGWFSDGRGRRTYGGYLRGNRPLEFRPAPVSGRSEACLTMNGNLVLVPRKVYDAIGPVDRAFPQAMGDFDYGLRATKAGFSVVQVPQESGSCDDFRAVIQDERRIVVLRRIANIKHFPPRAWWTFCRRHSGAWAPAYFLKPYIEALVLGRGAPR